MFRFKQKCDDRAVIRAIAAAGASEYAHRIKYASEFNELKAVRDAEVLVKDSGKKLSPHQRNVIRFAMHKLSITEDILSSLATAFESGRNSSIMVELSSLARMLQSSGAALEIGSLHEEAALIVDAEASYAMGRISNSDMEGGLLDKHQSEQDSFREAPTKIYEILDLIKQQRGARKEASNEYNNGINFGNSRALKANRSKTANIIHSKGSKNDASKRWLLIESSGHLVDLNRGLAYSPEDVRYNNIAGGYELDDPEIQWLSDKEVSVQNV